ncbi:MAG: protoporphyrinogen oxidase [Pirellulales bacterium]
MHRSQEESEVARPPAGGRPRVAVVGAGISGLAAAHRLRELRPDCELTVFEAADRPGGLLQTVRRDGCLLELSADNFLTSLPAATKLARRIGCGDDLIETTPGERRAYVVSRGQLQPVPAGFSLLSPSLLWPVLTTPTLSLRGKLRLAAERFVRPRQETTDESLAQFARRRLGAEAYERLVQPLVGGIYTADPERLSLLATLPRFAQMERQYGSLTRAALRGGAGDANADRATSGARYSLFVAPREGMESLVAALAARLPTGALRLRTPVERLERLPSGAWRLTAAGVTADFDAVVLAAPAPKAATLLRTIDAALSADLGGIAHASSAVVALAYDRSDLGWPLHGFGFVVPACERRRILAGSFASEKFPGRAPPGQVLVRAFLGGELQPELLEQPDEALACAAEEELAELLKIGAPPKWRQVIRWPQAMPLYHLGHLDRIARIEQALERSPGLALAGNAYHGVGVPQCVASGEAAAERVVQHLEAASKPLG